MSNGRYKSASDEDLGRLLPRTFSRFAGTLFLVSLALLPLRPEAAGAAEVETSPEALEERFSAAGLSVGPARAFFSALQDAVRNRDAETFSKLTGFPLRAAVGTGERILRTPEELQMAYDQVVCERVRTVVLDQDFNALFVNWKGVMIGRGEIWFNGLYTDDACESGEIVVTAINGPFEGYCPDAG